MWETAAATRAGPYGKGAENTGEGKGRKKYFRISRDKKAEGGDGQLVREAEAPRGKRGSIKWKQRRKTKGFHQRSGTTEIQRQRNMNSPKMKEKST